MSEGATTIVQCGRRISAREIDLICSTVRLFPNLSRWELASTVSEHLGWYTASGGLKVQASLQLLEKLEDRCAVRLPAKDPVASRTKRWHRPVWTERTDPGPSLEATVRELQPIVLQEVSDRQDVELWNEYTDRYHYLGYRKPFGCTMRYLVQCHAGLLGCLLLAGAARAIAVRDRWIGWTSLQRQRNLAWLINNSRFLLLPWVRVPNLASHVLGLLSRQVADDWQRAWGYRPLLLETFIDPQRFSGTCYRAAGWLELGRTTGRQHRTTPKLVLVRPLTTDIWTQLCSDELLIGRSTP